MDIPGYDEWKLATPWDDEVEKTFYFECAACELEQETVETVGRNDSGTEVQCSNCNEPNWVELDED